MHLAFGQHSYFSCYCRFLESNLQTLFNTDCRLLNLKRVLALAWLGWDWKRTMAGSTRRCRTFGKAT
jgi:hypothetical protein